MRKRAIIIGGGVVDIPLAPVDAGIFDAHSTPLARIAMQPGGDAVNEAIALARLGHAPLLASKVGDDAAGDFLLRALAGAGVDTSAVIREPGLDTGINVVLVRPDGERCFVTNRNGSLRRLGLADILPALEGPAFDGVKVACLASLFVSPILTVDDSAALFRALRARGVVRCADTTRPKNGETAADLAPALRELDYFFPNRAEAAQLTGLTDPDAMADALLEEGLGCAVIKLGAGDCARLGCAAASLCVEAVGATAGLTDRAAVDARLRREDGR